MNDLTERVAIIERVAKIEVMVHSLTDEFTGPDGIRVFKNKVTEELVVLRESIKVLNWKITLFASLVVTIGSKVLEYGFKYFTGN